MIKKPCPPAADKLDWREHYKQTPLEKLSWYCPTPDHEAIAALDRWATGTFCESGPALDIGTGPGVMAATLAQRGYTVTACDLAPAAIDMAIKNLGTAADDINFVVDDILDSTLTGPYNLIHDRGCFHVFPKDKRADYVNTVVRIIAPGGLLLLKTFSAQEDMVGGPFRYTKEGLTTHFGDAFEFLYVDDNTTYPGTMGFEPKAVFCVLRRR